MVKDKATGATRPVRARYVVVADGANSRFGRALGTARDRDQPMGMALRGYYTSPGHDQPFIESHLDIRDGDGKVVPGYGWIFPLGDGRVNVGRGAALHRPAVEGRQHLDPDGPLRGRGARRSGSCPPATCLGPPTGGKLPMGLAVGPRVGATTLVVGDAAGSINPFNGEGIAYGYETGRLAAASLGEALCGDGVEALDRVRGPARGRLRPLLPGGPGLHPGDQPARAHAAVRGHRHALRDADELDPPDHGQPAPARRDRPGRGRLPGAGRSSPGWPPRAPEPTPVPGPGAAGHAGAHSVDWLRPSAAGDRVVGRGEGGRGHRGPLVVGSRRVSIRPPNMNASPITSLPWLGMVRVVRYPKAVTPAGALSVTACTWAVAPGTAADASDDWYWPKQVAKLAIGEGNLQGWA